MRLATSTATACHQRLHGPRGRICAEVRSEEGLGPGDRRPRGAHLARSRRARNAARTTRSWMAEVGTQPALVPELSAAAHPIERAETGPSFMPERSQLPA